MRRNYDGNTFTEQILWCATKKLCDFALWDGITGQTSGLILLHSICNAVLVIPKNLINPGIITSQNCLTCLRSQTPGIWKQNNMTGFTTFCLCALRRKSFIICKNYYIRWLLLEQLLRFCSLRLTDATFQICAQVKFRDFGWKHSYWQLRDFNCGLLEYVCTLIFENAVLMCLQKDRVHWCAGCCWLQHCGEHQGWWGHENSAPFERGCQRGMDIRQDQVSA